MRKRHQNYFLRISRSILILALQLIIIFFLFELVLRFSLFIWKDTYKFINRRDINFYIYVIGESCAYGEPFGPKISFPKLVAYVFNERINNKQIKIINLASRGRNVEFEYWQLFKELLIRPKSNAILLIYAGINDCVSESEGFDQAFRRWSFMQKSFVFSRIQYLLEGRIPPENALFNFFGLNNSLEKYKYRLEKTIVLAKSHNLKIVISSLAGNISQFSPQDDGIYTSNERGALAIYNQARDFEKQGEFNKAIELYRNILEFYSVYPSHIYYHLGKCYEGLQVYDKAKENYWKAVDIGDAVRPNHWRNEVIKDLAAKYMIGFVDALKIFEDASPNGLLGYNLFIDAHHPNLEGYILLAKGFAREMEKVLGEKISRSDITVEEVCNYFIFTKEDIAQMYIDRTWWLCLESLPIYDREERLKRAEYYLEKASEIKEDPLIYFWHFVIAVARNEEDKALYWLERGELLAKNAVVFNEKQYLLLYMDIFKLVLPQNIFNQVYELIRHKI